MLYAKVIVGLAVEGPFDYIVPQDFSSQIKIGARVWVDLRNKKTQGYVVGLSPNTKIKYLKPVKQLIDNEALLSKETLLLAKKISEFYCCSWGEAIDTILPFALRNGHEISPALSKFQKVVGRSSSKLLIHDLGIDRWGIYLEKIRQAIKESKSVILILPDIESVLWAKEKVGQAGFNIELLYRKQPRELETWARIRDGQINLVIGTRSSVFAPLLNLGLIIIEDEANSVYKQDQVPHYHLREVAFMRAELEGADVILGSAAPSLESYNLAKESKINYLLLKRKKNFPEINIVDMSRLAFADRKRKSLFSRPLEDAIYLNLMDKAKTLLFLNRAGFATSASCNNCGVDLKCPRCSINLVFHFKENILTCHYCNYKMDLPKICPNCNSGYIKLAGSGVEKIESELARIFPQARIKVLGGDGPFDINSADIFISTQHILKEHTGDFDLIGILAIDNSLNRVDFRSSEKTFSLVSNLSGLTTKKMIIQTRLTHHHIFNALKANDPDIFYQQELSQRKQLKFPPYKHFILVKVRGIKEDKVKETSRALFEELSQIKSTAIKVLALNPGNPAKIRGNYYWQILISSNNPVKAVQRLKNHLKKILHSGIIVTVDVDI